MTQHGLPTAAAHASHAGVPFEVERVKERLEAGNGGYEVVHASPGLEVGVYVLVAPEPDRQQPHDDDEIYVVLDGRGVLDVEGKPVPLERGQAVFVPAGARHQFTAYEQMSVLVIFARRWRIDAGRAPLPTPA
jgi:mannose-6-phosphate isomerase-like protein (cupin superfamily)